MNIFDIAICSKGPYYNILISHKKIRNKKMCLNEIIYWTIMSKTCTQINDLSCLRIYLVFTIHRNLVKCFVDELQLWANVLLIIIYNLNSSKLSILVWFLRSFWVYHIASIWPIVSATVSNLTAWQIGYISSTRCHRSSICRFFRFRYLSLKYLIFVSKCQNISSITFNRK